MERGRGRTWIFVQTPSLPPHMVPSYATADEGWGGGGLLLNQGGYEKPAPPCACLEKNNSIISTGYRCRAATRFYVDAIAGLAGHHQSMYRVAQKSKPLSYYRKIVLNRIKARQ